MEKLLQDISAYAKAVGRKPQTVLRAAIGSGWGAWEEWCAGKASPTVAVADRIYAYMEANPPKVALPETPNPEAAA